MYSYRKKVILALISLAMLMGLASVGYAAADLIPDIVKDFLESVFIRLPERAQNASDPTFLIFSKFLLWIVVFAVFQYGASKAFKDNTRIAGVIAGIGAFISVIMIPGEMIRFLFNQYATLVSVVLALVPVLVAIKLRKTIGADHPVMGNVILFLLGVIMVIIGSYFVATEFIAGDAGLISSFGQWIALIGLLTMIFGGIMLIGSASGSSWSQFGEGGSTSTAGLSPSERAARADKIREERKAEDLEKAALRANQKVMSVANEMETISGKLNQLETETKQALQEFEKTGNAAKEQAFLTSLEEILVNTVNAGKQIQSAIRGINRNPQAFAEHIDDVNDHIKKYKQYVENVIASLQKYKLRLESVKDHAKIIESLDKKHQKYLHILSNLDNLAFAKIAEELQIEDAANIEFGRIKGYVAHLENISDVQNANLKDLPDRPKDLAREDIVRLRNKLTTANRLLDELKNEDKKLQDDVRAFNQQADNWNKLKEYVDEDVALIDDDIKLLEQFSTFFTLSKEFQSFRDYQIKLFPGDTRRVRVHIPTYRQHCIDRGDMLEKLDQLNKQESALVSRIAAASNKIEQIAQLFAGDSRSHLETVIRSLKREGH